MSEAPVRLRRRKLVREVAVFQLKLLLSAGRDLVLVPMSLAAAAIDLVKTSKHEPRHFRSVLEIGQRSDHWIKQWHKADADAAPEGVNDVDALLHHIEGLVRDPKAGADKARMLSRWARMQQARRLRKEGGL